MRTIRLVTSEKENEISQIENDYYTLKAHLPKEGRASASSSSLSYLSRSAQTPEINGIDNLN